MTQEHIKLALYQFCKDFVVDRMSRIQAQMTEIKQALHSETKSSAGDKHETGRAMMQLEREKLGQQLAEAEKMNLLLSKVPTTINTQVICLGSVVKTKENLFYLGISAGPYSLSTATVYCISVATPIGQLLLGKQKGDMLVFNGKSLEILEIY